MLPVGRLLTQPFVLVSKPLKYEVSACAAVAVIATRPGTIRAPSARVMPKRLIRDLINGDLLSIDPPGSGGLLVLCAGRRRMDRRSAASGASFPIRGRRVAAP